MPLSQALADELRFLRKGRGTRRADLAKRLGTQAREFGAIVDQDDATAIRAKLTLKINDLLRKEAKDLRLAVLVALALHPEADQRLLRDRTLWLARTLSCEDRTARRRIEEAFDILIDRALSADCKPPVVHDSPLSNSWHTRSLRAVLRLDTPSPELIEQRTIVVAQDGLHEIVGLFSVPRAVNHGLLGHDLIAEVLYGGRIRRRERLSHEDFSFVVELPMSYRVGDTHDYAMIFRIPERQPMRPHYAFQPLRPCESFDLTVRFAPGALPRAIWRFSGVPLRAVDDNRPGSDPLYVDRVGELHLQFTDLTQGFAYGLKWSA